MTETTTPPPRSATSPKAMPRLTLRLRTPEPAPAPEPPPAPAPAPAAPPPQPEMAAPRRPERRPFKEPAFLAEFRRLSALVPPGSWPATLPLDAKASLRPRPLALGIARRIEVLLPEVEREALHRAIRHFARCAPYLRALAADGASRWSDDGTAPVEPVSDEHKAAAASMLEAKARRWAKREG